MIRRSKYNNKKCEYDGKTFDSEAEMIYYKRLQEEVKNGAITAFLTQQTYILLDDFQFEGRKKRGIKYICDFVVIHNDGKREVIDIKGMITDVFKLKYKMFIARYDEDITLYKYGKRKGFTKIVI